LPGAVAQVKEQLGLALRKAQTRKRALQTTLPSKGASLRLVEQPLKTLKHSRAN
jgi:hypothetical protein